MQERIYQVNIGDNSQHRIAAAVIAVNRWQKICGRVRIFTNNGASYTLESWKDMSIIDSNRVRKVSTSNLMENNFFRC